MATICEEQFSGTQHIQRSASPNYTRTLLEDGKNKGANKAKTSNTVGLKPFAVAAIAYKALVNRYRLKQQQRINRDAFKHMLALSDELLDDIGVTRYDVRWAAQLPISVDAACALREVSKGASQDCRL